MVHRHQWQMSAELDHGSEGKGATGQAKVGHWEQ